MNLNRVSVELPFSSGGTFLFQEASDLFQLNATGSQQHSCENQDNNQIEWTNDQRRFPVNGMIGNRMYVLNLLFVFPWTKLLKLGYMMSCE